MNTTQELHLTVFQLRERAQFLKNAQMFSSAYLCERVSRLLEEFLNSASAQERDRLENLIGMQLRLGPLTIAKDGAKKR